jgi:hypothetical protein
LSGLLSAPAPPVLGIKVSVIHLSVLCILSMIVLQLADKQKGLSAWNEPAPTT